jgi:hypothetical protein
MSEEVTNTLKPKKGNSRVNRNNNSTPKRSRGKNSQNNKSQNKKTGGSSKRPNQNYIDPKVKPTNFLEKKTNTTFAEIEYTDKVVILLGLITILSSLFMWFNGYREEATFVGIWTTGVFSASCFIRLSFTRAKRK